MNITGWRYSFICAAALLTLSGCQTTAEGMKQSFNDFFSGKHWQSSKIASAGGCPQVKMVEDLRSLSEFNDMDRAEPDKVVSTVTLASLDSTCEYDARKDIATLSLMMAFESRLGPKGRIRAGDKPNFVYPYFIAVTTRQGDIVAKEVYAVAMAYDNKQTELASTETLKKLIPLDGKGASDYEILVGFQLSDEQLAYNRTRSATEPEAAALAKIAEKAEKIEPAAGNAATAAETKAPAMPVVKVINQKVAVRTLDQEGESDASAAPAVSAEKPQASKSPEKSPAAADEASGGTETIDITEPAN